MESQTQAPWAELARTALAEASSATLELRECRTGTSSRTTVSLRGGDDPRPTLRLEASSPAVSRLAACRVGTLTVAGPGPWALRLVGTFVMERPDERGVRSYRPTLLSVRLVGPRDVTIPVEQFLRTAPDPLHASAAAVLDHLAASHHDALLACARAQSGQSAQSGTEDGAEAIAVLPRRLDQHGLELAVLDAHGVRRLHLPFPGGPVHTLTDVPADFPVPLTCACLA